MVRVSKAKLLGACISSALTSVVLFGGGLAASTFNDPELLMIGAWLIVSGVLLSMLVYVVVMSILIHRMWASIQFGGARTTPGKAVGLCFVPFFNLYWIFPAIRGWAVEFNRIIAARQIAAPRMSEGLALAVPLCILLSMLPYCGIPVAMTVVILVAVFIARAADSINGLADAMEQGTAVVAGPVPTPSGTSIAPAPTASPVPVADAATIPVAAAGRLSKMAVFSLILSILGFVTASLGGLVGIILGFVAWRRIRDPKRQLRGRGIAIAGVFVGFASLLVTVLAAAGAIAFYYSARQVGTNSRILPPQWASPAPEPTPAPSPAPARALGTFAGTVKAARTVVVTSTQAGDAEKILVTEGQVVKAGETLVQFDSTDAKATLDEAEAALKEAATARQDARKKLTRIRQLLKEGAASREDLQTASEESKAADEAYNEAKEARDTAKTAMGELAITSPIAGQVTEVLISEGESVDIDAELIRISDLSRLDVVLDVPTSIAERLQVGQRHRIEFADEGKTFSGTLRTIESDPDNNTCTITLQITDPQDLKVGAEVTVSISEPSASTP